MIYFKSQKIKKSSFPRFTPSQPVILRTNLFKHNIFNLKYKYSTCSSNKY